VSNVSWELQGKLLRVIESRRVRPVGGEHEQDINVRIIAATNKDLHAMVKDGKFREDLYYRLNVIPLQVPPLRDRSEDIPLLAMHFLKTKISADTGLPFQITRRALDVLSAHSWPGNVRELENALERAAALCESRVIRVRDLPPALHAHVSPDDKEELAQMPDTQFLSKQGIPSDVAIHASDAAVPAHPGEPLRPLKEFMREQEVSYISRIMAHAAGDKERTAQLLGVSLATLYRKLSEDDGQL